MNFSQAAQSGKFQTSYTPNKSRMAGDYLQKFQPELSSFTPRQKIDHQSYGSQMGMIDPASQVAADYSTVANKADQERREKMTEVPLRETTNLNF
tara:strand:- start:1134 stop:1418 length:285 start_codon:yes stop_codon:yes gene_type:complete